MARQLAADELADRLKDVADRLAARGVPIKRVPFGNSRGLVKRRSPKGFVLDSLAPQLLLPDGRLWHYDTRMNPDGIFYDARVDHPRSMHGSVPLGDFRFSFLGAVVSKHSFGYRHPVDDTAATIYELGAVVGTDGGSIRFVAIGEALAAITAKI